MFVSEIDHCYVVETILNVSFVDVIIYMILCLKW